MIEFFKTWLDSFEWFILAYFILLNTSYLLLIILATVDFTKYFRRKPFSGSEDIFANPMTPGVSVIVPAYNEEVGIVDNVRAMLSLRFPKFEIVVVDDGSSDSTFSLMQDAFGLIETPRHVEGSIELTGQIQSIWVAKNGEPLVVVRKTNGKSRSDACNAGLNVARLDVVCMVDADSLLDSDALLRVIKPFVDDPDHVVATGGVIRPANGCLVEEGQIVKANMPTQWTARIQVIEYLRSFLLGRTGWSTLQGLLIISGAFGVFRRDIIMELGGLDRHCMGEDAELVARLHHKLRNEGRRDYKIVFVSEPVCWTEVPAERKVLARQRRRWSRGLAEVLWKHKGMMFNPRYGRIGLVVLPYYLFFELLTPVIEIAGALVMVVLGAAWLFGNLLNQPELAGLLNVEFAILFAIVAVGYGFLLSLAALTVEEFSFHRMNSWRDLWVSFVASIIENIGYRQLHAWWRLDGLIWWLRQGEANWGAMPRTGYVTKPGAGKIDQAPVPLPAQDHREHAE